jgi:hypothetical protein
MLSRPWDTALRLGWSYGAFSFGCQLRFGSAGIIVTAPCSSTDTTYRSRPPRPRSRLKNDLRLMIAWVAVCVSIAKPSRSFVAKNASRAFVRLPVGSISPATGNAFGFKNLTPSSR